MNLFDIFEGAIDDLEARRIEDLNAKMDDLTARARATSDPRVKEALRHEFAKAKAERDSYYKINVDEAPGAETLAHNQSTDASNLEALGLAEAGKTMDPEEVGYILSKATIQKIVNNVFAQKLPDVKPIVKTLDKDNGAYSITTPDDMFRLELSVLGQEGDIGVFVENAYNSYKGSGVVTDIIRDCFATAERQWGTPQTRTLQPVQDTGHGVWQAMADKLGVTYEAGVKTTDTSAAATTGKPKAGSDAVGTPPKPGNTKTAILVIKSNGMKWAPMDITAEQGQEYIDGQVDNPITLQWIDGTEKSADVVKEHGGGGGGPAQWHSYVRAHRANEDELDEHGGGVNAMKDYISWRKKANTERGITKAPPPVGKSAPNKLHTIPKGTVHGKLDQSRGVVPKASFEEEWSQKYKKSINCSHPKGFSQKAHCAGKKKHNESIEMESVCPDCGMCQTHGNLNEIKKGQKDSNGYTKCWPGKHAEGTKKGKNGGMVRNCVPNESIEEGWQDFNKVEPYAVCLAGKPVKKFDYYEEARRFHDNWKKKLYNQGEKEKADKITLMPLNLGEAANPAQQAAIAIAKKKEKQVTENNFEGLYSPEAIKLGNHFIKEFNLTNEIDQQLAIEIVDNDIEGGETDPAVIRKDVIKYLRKSGTVIKTSKNEASMNWASHKATGPKFSGYLKGTDPAPTEYSNKSFGAEAKENPMGAKELEYLIAKAKEMPHTPKPNLHHGDEHEISKDELEVEEGIQGNMTVKSAPITHPLRQRNFVAKNAIQSGAGKHANQLKKAAAAGRHAKHKGQPLDISEGENFLSWAVRNGYNLTKPAVYESARNTYKALLEDCGPIAPHQTYYGAMDEDLKQGEFYVWTVYFDDGSSKRIKVTHDDFDPYKYYAKEKKNVVNVDYNWNKHQ